MTDRCDIQGVFGQDGMFSKAMDGYQPRQGQIQMAEAVLQALEGSGRLVAEAPTGTGKSLAYSAPATWWAHHRKQRVVIATANIALQEQLVEKDLPFLREVLPWPFTFALAKGIGNYLCEEKLRKAVPDMVEAEKEDQIRAWAARTETGDKSELPFEPKALWSKFSTTSQECLGNKCGHYEECHAMRAKHRYHKADVVVCNYHLLYAHVDVLGRTGQEAVLGPFQAVILDEAHKAADTARDVFGFRMTERSTTRFVKALERTGNSALGASLKKAASYFFADMKVLHDSDDYKVRLREPLGGTHERLSETLEKASVALENAAALEEDVKEKARLGTAAKGAFKDHRQLKAFGELAHPNLVYYLEPAGTGVALRCKFIDVSGILRNGLFGNVKASVLTSATLSVDGRFDFVTGETGLDGATGLVVDSPFDYQRQALLVTPPMPPPNDPGFAGAVGMVMRQAIEASKGRTLCLFTSYRVMDVAYQQLQGLPYRILKQGDKPRMQLIREFKEDTASVLLGTESFWAGVDVPGESLSTVIIDKFPFVGPSDPILDAVSAKNRRWFFDWSVPRAVIAFKQGVGRLIRTTTDTGTIVLLDNRLTTKGYGAKFVRSLPPMARETHLGAIEQHLGRTA